MERSSLNKSLTTIAAKLDWEKTLYLVLIVLALGTRLWGLGDRVQSHDESIHTKYSWNLYRGHGFQHNPLMHGPFLFHTTALSYLLFGDNDFTARLPVALMGVALVAFPYLFRRWLGRGGALIASFLLLISPSIAYYSRYIRHDIPVALWALIVVFAILSHLRDGQKRWFYVMAAGVSLMFATKEVAFIYAAIFGSFLVVQLVVQALGQVWPREDLKPWFVTTLAIVGVSLLIFGAGLMVHALNRQDEALQIQEVVQAQQPARDYSTLLAIIGGVLTALSVLGAAGILLAGHLTRKELAFPSPVVALIAVVVVVGVLFRLVLPLPLSYTSCVEQGIVSKEDRWVCAQETLRSFAWPAGRYLLPGLPFVAGGTGVYVGVRLVLTVLPFASGLFVIVAWLAITAFRRYRAFDLIVVLGTFCLPLLCPFLISLSNLDPISYATPTLFYSAAIAIETFLASVAVGLSWDMWRQVDKGDPFSWLVSAAIFYVIFVILFSTVLTNGYGIPSGIVGSLGYWLKQQDVKRGGQPWYYYIIMTSFYEFLPLLLSFVAVAYLIVRRLIASLVSAIEEVWSDSGRAFSEALRSRLSPSDDWPALKGHFIPLVLWWVALAWVAYSFAGEKMPWLTVHLALPMILLSGWLVGRLIKGVAWRQVFQRPVWLSALIVPPLVISLALLVRAITVPSARPFQGAGLTQLYSSGHFANGVLGTLLFGTLGYLIVRKSRWSVVARFLLVVALLLPISLTIRTAWRFCYITDEYPTEFLVYAHAAPGVREAMEQIEELSRRVAGGEKQIKVAYGADGSTLFYWQLRDYPNAVFYGETPSREQMESPVIIAGRDQWDDVAPYLGNEYLVNTYTFLWWPMQDYFHLSKERILGALRNPEMRAALWDIWFYRDYRKYEQVTGRAHTLPEWPLRSDFRLYVRRDVAEQMWDLGVAEREILAPPVDPYAEGWRALAARQVFGTTGSTPGQLQFPRGIATGPDGSVYVADSGNHRIQKFTADGQFVAAWGDVCRLYDGNREGCQSPDGAGEFNDPWDVAVAPDGTIYVADTWNHRIQRLDREGSPINAWGLFGEHSARDQAGQSVFYGPRGIAVGPDGRVYVSDTGNKRIQVFYPDGLFALQWGGGGVLEGYLDEPVGIAFGPAGTVFVADTWNRRVQVFDRNGNFLRHWAVAGWDVGHAEEKPYLAVDSSGYVYVTDPAHYRVLVFDSLGNYVLSFGQYGFDEYSFALPMGIAIGRDDSIYVTDAHGNRVVVYDPLGLRAEPEVQPGIVAPALDSPTTGEELPAGELMLTGRGEPGSWLRILVDGKAVGVVRVRDDGTWSLAAELNEPGEYEIVASVISADREIVVTSSPVLVTVVAAVTVPSLDIPTDGAELPGGELALAGTGEPGSELEVSDNGIVIGTAVVDEDGRWQFTFVPEEGDHEFVVWPVGDEGAASNVVNMTVLTPPAANACAFPAGACNGDT